MIRQPLPIFFCNVLWAVTKPRGTWFIHKKHELLVRYLGKDLDQVISKHRDRAVEMPPAPAIPKRVWTLWYTKDNQPELVEHCLRRMKRSLEPLGYEVTVLDKGNISSYVDMSDLDPFLERGDIAIQFYSDLLRARLLRKYGGFWIDSTMAVLDPQGLEAMRLSVPFISITKTPRWPQSHNYVLGDKWTAFFWGTYEGNPFFEYLDDAFTYFLKKHHGIFDYLHIDYTIACGYTYVPYIKDQIDSFKAFYPETIDNTTLVGLLNEPFDASKLDQITKEAPVQKLTYKGFQPLKDRGETFYTYLARTWEEA